MKLLIIGANPETIPLIETAKEMGVYVLVTDNNPNALAKKFADQAFNVDGMDVEGLISLAKEQKVNGILVGVADRLIVPYQKVCDALGLPCYGTEEQCQIFTDKERFNELCEKYNIPTIPNYNITEELIFNNTYNIEYPVIVKPVDGNSGKGMSICHNNKDLKIGIQKTIKFSKRKKFIVEKYMDCDDMFIYYTFKDGKILVSAIADRYTSKEQGDLSKVCVGAIYPSKFSNLYFDKVHGNMCRLFKDLNVQNGVFMISAFVEKGNLFLYDPGFRLQGEAPNIPIEALGGYDQKSMLINFALTGSMGSLEFDQINDFRFGGKYAATLWLLCKRGKISKIEGLEKIKKDKSVIKVLQRLYPGDIVTEDMIGTEAQVVARIYLISTSKQKLLLKINEYLESVEIYDDRGKSLLLSTMKKYYFKQY